ncbi:Ppx/GppA family phosphatase [Janibacter sp. G56]|uniref:Ppx/GppA phosphatase family protein n=1 Tax=Janibacter sp. G56 TaxID=3418717 RepID=UPI003D06AE46
MRLGVIDVGSNTVHLLVVDAHFGAQPLPAAGHKVELRLSERVTEAGLISDTVRDELIQFVAECTQIAEDQGVEETLAFATSAIREAPNGDAVLAAVREQTGVELRVLTGESESRLTFLAVRRWFGWSSGTLLVMDIGGGSLELAVGMDEDPDVAVSLPLGAGRLTRELLQGDPPTPEQIRSARREVRAAIAASVRPITKVGPPDRVVGTSKTFRSLARIAGAAPSSDGPYVPRVLRKNDVSEVIRRIAGMTASERAQIPGVSATRAQQSLAGAIVAEAAMDLLGVDQLEICPWALREGVILRRLDTIDDPGLDVIDMPQVDAS